MRTLRQRSSPGKQKRRRRRGASYTLRPVSQTETRRGVLYALAAYGMWGLFPLYWKQLGHVPAPAQLAHRITWALLFYFFLAWRAGLHREVFLALGRPRQRRAIVASAVLIAVNWFCFVYAIEQRMILQASLGYFINPLVSVLLGMLVLRERLRRGQWLAVALAAVGIGIMATGAREGLWISAALAASFGLYGLVRKVSSVPSMVGVTAEALLLTPFCLVAIFSWELGGEGHLGVDARTTILLLGTGVITALPLIAFGAAAKRISLSLLGFLQYLAPTGQFMLAVWVYGEPLDPRRLGAFVAIWLALAVFSIEARIRSRTLAKTQPPARG